MKRQSKSALRFVSVVFRHGNRAPTAVELKFLSNDGHSYNNFYPIGLGGLTNEGKQNMFRLGKELRKRYANFLEDTYIPEHVEARTTDTIRSKMSLDLALAGLYPPAENQIWNQDLKWQPIPTISVPLVDDVLLYAQGASPQYVDETERVILLPEVIKKAEDFRPFAKKLSNLMGKPIINILDMWVIYNGLKSFQSVGIELPQWANDIFPDGVLYDAACLQYEIFNYTELQRKLNGGVLLKKMVDDMKVIMKSDNMANARKIHLYSAHELNIAACLANLGLFKPHVPEYSSAVIVELIQHDEAYFVKVIHYLGNPAEFVEQEILDCGTLCPFDKFVDLLKNVTPSHEEIRSPSTEVDNVALVKRLRRAQFQ